MGLDFLFTIPYIESVMIRLLQYPFPSPIINRPKTKKGMRDAFVDKKLTESDPGVKSVNLSREKSGHFFSPRPGNR